MPLKIYLSQKCSLSSKNATIAFLTGTGNRWLTIAILWWRALAVSTNQASWVSCHDEILKKTYITPLRKLHLLMSSNRGRDKDGGATSLIYQQYVIVSFSTDCLLCVLFLSSPSSDPFMLPDFLLPGRTFSGRTTASSLSGSLISLCIGRDTPGKPVDIWSCAQSSSTKRFRNGEIS